MVINKILGVLGGMGPLATADLFRRIVLLTDAGTDQEHLRIIIDSNTNIPDRTQHLLGGGADPLPCLIESAVFLENAGVDVIIMPCNTAHYFYNKIKESVRTPFLSMLVETAKALGGSEVKKAGLLATEGTCRTGLYEKVLKGYNIDVIKPDSVSQSIVTDVIRTVKAGGSVSEGTLVTMAKNLEDKGAETLILGCTEISTAFCMRGLSGNYTDPMDEIAKSAIRFLNKSVRAAVE